MDMPRRLEVLVTGGSGFLGKSIVEALLAEHPTWSISILDVRRPPATLEKQLHFYLHADITSVSSVNQAFKLYRPDLVVHTAGVVPSKARRYSTREKDWQRVKSINVTGTHHVLDAALAAGCRYFLYTSSCTVLVDDLSRDYPYMNETMPTGNATLHYGRSKTLAETYVLSPQHAAKGLKACALRPATIIGAGDSAVLETMHALIAQRSTRFVVGTGDNLYDFMHVDNAVHAHMLAIQNLLTTGTAAGEAFFVSNQQPIYFWDFLAGIWAEFGHVPAFRVHVPVVLALVFGWVLEWVAWVVGMEAVLDRGSVRDGVRTCYSDNAKAMRVLGYRPVVGLPEGVRLACADYRKVLDAKEAKKVEGGEGKKQR